MTRPSLAALSTLSSILARPPRLRDFAHDYASSSDTVPEFSVQLPASSFDSSLFCSGLDASVLAINSQESCCPGEMSKTQRPEQTHSASQGMVSGLVKDEAVSSELLLSPAEPTLICKQGLCWDRKETLVKKKEAKQDTAKGVTQSVVMQDPLDQGSCQIAKLDSGCLYTILSHLDNTTLSSCSLACRQRFEITNDVRNSSRLQQPIQLSLIPAMLSRFTRIKTLIIEAAAVVGCLDDCFLGQIAIGAPQLQHLEIQECGGLKDTGLATLLKGCSDLRMLCLEKCDSFSGVAFVGVRCKLEELVLQNCSGVTNEGLHAIAEACSKLSHLSLIRKEEGVSLAGSLESVAQRCSQLTSLHLHASGTANTTLRAFGIGCPQLAHLKLSCEHDVTDAGLVSLTSRLYQLQHLDILDNRQLTRVPNSGPGLRLKSLHVGCLANTPDEVLQKVCEEESLIELGLHNCPALSNDTVQKILASCGRLERLLIEGNSLVGSEIFKVYAKCKNMPKLIIKSCERFRDVKPFVGRFRLLANVSVE